MINNQNLIASIMECIHEKNIDGMIKILNTAASAAEADNDMFSCGTDSGVPMIIASIMNKLAADDPDFFTDSCLKKALYALNKSLRPMKNYYGGYSTAALLEVLVKMTFDKDPRGVKFLELVPEISPVFIDESGTDIFFYSLIASMDSSDNREMLEKMSEFVDMSISNVLPDRLKGIWLYISVLISKGMTEVLDRVTAQVYNNNNFVDYMYNFYESGCSCVKLTKYLYSRYCPELSPEEVGKLILDSSYIMKFRYEYLSNKQAAEVTPYLVNELLEIAETGVRISSVNKILDYYFMFDGNAFLDILSELTADDAVLNINDYRCNVRGLYDQLKRIWKNKPGIRVTIDNSKEPLPGDDEEMNDCLIFNDEEISVLLKKHNLILTDSVKDNICFKKLIKAEADVLFVLLENLQLNKKMIEELIELCVENRSVRVLDKINRMYGHLLDCNGTE